MGELLKQCLRGGEQKTESVVQVELMAPEKHVENPSKRTGNKVKNVGVNSGNKVAFFEVL